MLGFGELRIACTHRDPGQGAVGHGEGGGEGVRGGRSRVGPGSQLRHPGRCRGYSGPNAYLGMPRVDFTVHGQNAVCLHVDTTPVAPAEVHTVVHLVLAQAFHNHNHSHTSGPARLQDAQQGFCVAGGCATNGMVTPAHHVPTYTPQHGMRTGVIPKGTVHRSKK